ncbi:MAG: hypothetical protein AAGA45_05260, partial [Verrucomicrobiota bacterium]
ENYQRRTGDRVRSWNEVESAAPDLRLSEFKQYEIAIEADGPIIMTIQVNERCGFLIDSDYAVAWLQ